MAKRKMLFHPDYVREKIRASQLINRLHACAFGEIGLTMIQLRAIEIFLRKCLPDLAAAEIIQTEQAQRYMIEVPMVMDDAEWEAEALKLTYSTMRPTSLSLSAEDFTSFSSRNQSTSTCHVEKTASSPWRGVDHLMRGRGSLTRQRGPQSHR
jgi:hypothetical protein